MTWGTSSVHYLLHLLPCYRRRPLSFFLRRFGAIQQLPGHQIRSVLSSQAATHTEVQPRTATTSNPLRDSCWGRRDLVPSDTIRHSSRIWIHITSPFCGLPFLWRFSLLTASSSASASYHLSSSSCHVSLHRFLRFHLPLPGRAASTGFLQHEETQRTTGSLKGMSWDGINYIWVSAKQSAHWRFNCAPRRLDLQPFSTIAEYLISLPRPASVARDDETRSTLLLSCPNHDSDRWKSYEAAGTDRYKQILGTEKGSPSGITMGHKGGTGAILAFQRANG